MPPRPEAASAARLRYARSILAGARGAGLPTERVEAAFAAVPRERYLPSPPWRIFAPGSFSHLDTSDPADLYADVLVVLDASRGINNGQPSLHALWMAAVDPRAGETVVQIGVGSGYYTALLAELVGPSGQVDAYEIEPKLAALAKQNLADRPGVSVRPTTGLGRELPEADVVYVSAGAGAPDVAWLRALRIGGRLIMPWQPDPGRGRTLLVTREASGFAARLMAEVLFVACVGADRRDRRPVAAATKPLESTRSLRLTGPPDDSATAIYADLWFSARDP